jgi:anti-sigma factor RsiW
MSCPGELITGYVDDALDAAGRVEAEAHLDICGDCRSQLEAERALRLRLRALPAPKVPEMLATRVRGRLRTSRAGNAGRVLLALAAALVAVLLWARGMPVVVEWQLAMDHGHCFGREHLPAEVWSGDPAIISAWFEARGTTLPLVPAAALGLELSGARFCRLFDRRQVAHLYYVAGPRHASLYVVPDPVRFDTMPASARGDRTVQLLHVAGATVGLVGEHEEDVEALKNAFVVSYAEACAAARAGCP